MNKWIWVSVDPFHWCRYAWSSLCVLIWWRHKMETFSALLAICAGNSPVTDEVLAQRPVTRSFDVFFDLCYSNANYTLQWNKIMKLNIKEAEHVFCIFGYLSFDVNVVKSWRPYKCIIVRIFMSETICNSLERTWPWWGFPNTFSE